MPACFSRRFTTMRAKLSEVPSLGVTTCARKAPLVTLSTLCSQHTLQHALALQFPGVPANLFG